MTSRLKMVSPLMARRVVGVGLKMYLDHAKGAATAEVASLDWAGVTSADLEVSEADLDVIKFQQAAGQVAHQH